MNAKELRIGNIVQSAVKSDMVTSLLHGGYGYFEVSLLMIKDCEFYGDKWAFAPIPITPNILDSCGFVKDGFRSYNLSINQFSEGIKLLCFSGDYLYLKEGRDIVTIWNKRVMGDFYLHQLQNLVYLLTQKELNVDL